MKNYIQDGDTLTLAAPTGGVVSGNAYLFGVGLFGVAVATVAQTLPCAIKTTGVFELPKTSALAIAVGDLLYWDDTAKVLNKTSAANTLVGSAVAAAVNPSPTVKIRLNV